MADLKPFFRFAAATGWLLLGVGCTTMESQRAKHPDPNARLDQMLALYQLERAGGGSCMEIWRADRATIDCDRILREVERLHNEFPTNPRVLMTSATMNYQAGRPDKAQYSLDQLLRQSGAHPEAAILRSQIALEEGNSILAKDLLQRQIMLAPNHAGLREALASAYYLDGEYAKARTQLGIAGRLGTPGWRLSYHHGLICEGEAKWGQACRYYSTSLEQRPNYSPALARLTGLVEHPACRNPALFDYESVLAPPSKGTIEELSFRLGPEGEAEVILMASAPGLFVESYLDTREGATIRVTLPGVSSAVGRDPLQIDIGQVRRVQVLESDGATQVEIQLTQPADHELIHRGNQIVIAVDGA